VILLVIIGLICVIAIASIPYFGVVATTILRAMMFFITLWEFFCMRSPAMVESMD
jgi:hypothetical protein